MALAKKPVTGRDITPAEMQIREYVMNQIKETYKSFGFTPDRDTLRRAYRKPDQQTGREIMRN